MAPGPPSPRIGGCLSEASSLLLAHLCTACATTALACGAQGLARCRPQMTRWPTWLCCSDCVSKNSRLNAAGFNAAETEDLAQCPAPANHRSAAAPNLPGWRRPRAKAALLGFSLLGGVRQSLCIQGCGTPPFAARTIWSNDRQLCGDANRTADVVCGSAAPGRFSRTQPLRLDAAGHVELDAANGRFQVERSMDEIAVAASSAPGCDQANQNQWSPYRHCTPRDRHIGRLQWVRC